MVEISDTKASHQPFHRQDMLPAELPPVGQRGAVKWARENLFSGPFNTVLTLLGLFIIGFILVRALPWWINGVWNAKSLSECRAIIAASGAETGACWAVIKERWHQYIFGFYPTEFYWRPILAFGLLFAAMSPILFWNDRKGAILSLIAGVLTVFSMLAMQVPSSVTLLTLVIFAAIIAVAWARPTKLIWVTALYPFLSIWLLWGGSFWSPINAILAVAVGIGAAKLYYRNPSQTLNIIYALAVAIAAAWLAAILIGYADSISGDFLSRLNRQQFWQDFFAESNFIVKAIGTLLSILYWLVIGVVWVLLAVLRAVSFVLNLGLGSVTDQPFARYFTVGSVLAFAGVLAAGRNRAGIIGILGGILAGSAWFAWLGPWLLAPLAAALPWGIAAASSDKFGGFLLAFVIGVTAITASLPLGIALALGRRSDMWLMKVLSVGFIEFIRGVPLITLLFTASLLLQYFLPPQTNFDLILRVIILASLFSAAYLAEVIRGGLAALPRGQYEAGDSLGLNYWQAQQLIVMPQALKVSIPGIVSTFIGLFKDTTLVSFVGLLDPLRGVTMAVRADINWKGIYWEPYIFVGAIFFLFCFGMSRYSMYLERKLKTDHR